MFGRISVFSLFVLFVVTSIYSQQKPYKLGILKKYDILENPEYQEIQSRYFNYTPEPDIIQSLKEAPDHYMFEIYMGFWCSTSRAFLPKFLKIVDLIGIPPQRIRIISIDKDKTEPREHLVNRKVQFIPTVIIRKGQVEVNRIVEYPVANIEADLASIILDGEYSPFHTLKSRND